MKSNRSKIIFRIFTYFLIPSILLLAVCIQSCNNPGKLPPNTTSNTDTSKKKSIVLKHRNSSLERQISGTGKNLYGVNRYRAGTVLVSGDSGTILTTINGGLNWVTQNSSVGENLRAAYCVNKDTMLASGFSGTIIRSSDKGVNWSNVSLIGIHKPLRSISFGDKNTGYICGDSGTVLISTNSGVGWTSLSSFTQKDLYGICFLNKDTGFVVGKNGVIYHTSNAGLNWDSVSSGTTKDLTSISFSGKRIGTIVGITSTILETTDGGNSWSVRTSSLTADFLSVTRLSNKLCFYVGHGSEAIASACGNENVISNSLGGQSQNGVSGAGANQDLDGSNTYGSAIVVGNGGQISLIFAPGCTSCSDVSPNPHDVVLLTSVDNCHWILTVAANENNLYNNFLKIITPGAEIECHISGWTQRDQVGTHSGDLYERLQGNTKTNIHNRTSLTGFQPTYNFPSTNDFISSGTDLMTFALTNNAAFSNELNIEFTLAFPSTLPASLEVYFGNISSNPDSKESTTDCGDCFQTRYDVNCSH